MSIKKCYILLIISPLLVGLSLFAFAEKDIIKVNNTDIKTDVMVQNPQDLVNSEQPIYVASACTPSHPYYCSSDGDYHYCCRADEPICCGEICCKAGSTCLYAGCCKPPGSGDECPAGSCGFCPATHPACIGWPGTNYICCTRDSVACNIGTDVWCCNTGQMCGSFKGDCK